MQGPPYDVALSRCVGPSEPQRPRWTLDSQSVGSHSIVCGALRGLDIQSIYGALGDPDRRWICGALSPSAGSSIRYAS